MTVSATLGIIALYIACSVLSVVITEARARRRHKEEERRWQDWLAQQGDRGEQW